MPAHTGGGSHPIWSFFLNDFFPLWPMIGEEGLDKRLPTFATINFPNFNLRTYLGRGSLTGEREIFGYIMNTLSEVCLVYYE